MLDVIIYRVPFKINDKLAVEFNKESIMVQKNILMKYNEAVRGQKTPLVEVLSTKGNFVSEHDYNTLDEEYWTHYPLSIETEDKVVVYNSKSRERSSYFEIISKKEYQIADLQNICLDFISDKRFYVTFYFNVNSNDMFQEDIIVLETKYKYRTDIPKEIFGTINHDKREYSIVKHSDLNGEVVYDKGLIKGSTICQFIVKSGDIGLNLSNRYRKEFKEHCVNKMIDKSEETIRKEQEKIEKLKKYI